MAQIKTRDYDVVVIGGGPAGMGAALAAHEAGASTVVIERNEHLGGILRQCIHPGFGLTHFKEELTGPEYAQRFINRVREAGIDVMLGSMALGIDEGGREDAAHSVTVMGEDGMVRLTCRSVVLAMGCRERTRFEIKIPGSRPAGVYTAGLAQRYINIENLRPGHRVVILGSGDIGLIMARRCALEGLEVEGVYELMPYANGLHRNVKNCLEDFGIPLHLSTTVTRVIGRGRVEAVEVSNVGEDLSPIPGTERIIPCDTLLLSVGLIPENELARAAEVEIDPRTRGARVDQDLQTNVDGIFSCGNVLQVHDLADNVTAEATRAGAAAAAHALGTAHPDALYRTRDPRARRHGRLHRAGAHQPNGSHEGVLPRASPPRARPARDPCGRCRSLPRQDARLQAEHHGSGSHYAQDARRRETGRDPDRIHRPRGRSVMSHDEH